MSLQHSSSLTTFVNQSHSAALRSKNQPVAGALHKSTFAYCLHALPQTKFQGLHAACSVLQI